MTTEMTFQLRTKHFTGHTRMTPDAFQARTERAGEGVTTVERPGYVEVLKRGVHIARYLPIQQVLWHEVVQAEDETHRPPDADDSWPPLCPECGSEMQVKFSRHNGGGAFWSCRLFDTPGHVCRGRREFTLHPEELAEYQNQVSQWNPHWSPAANKRVHRARWEQLAGKSLERLGFR